MVEGSVGVLWRADSHLGEVQVVDGVGGDRGGNGILLPLLVRLANQDSSTHEPKKDNKNPKDLCRRCLKETFNIRNGSKRLTLAEYIYVKPWIVDDSRNSLNISIALQHHLKLSSHGFVIAFIYISQYFDDEETFVMVWEELSCHHFGFLVDLCSLVSFNVAQKLMSIFHMVYNGRALVSLKGAVHI